MQLYSDISQIEKPFAHACVTIGNFDGVHLGHQQLFAEVVKRAKACQGTSIAITFDPHPLQILMPDRLKLISTYQHKLELIEKAGIDVLLVIPFSLEFAKTTAEEFVAEILVEKLGTKELVIGYDYAFGKGRSGNIRFLQKQGQRFGFPVKVVNAFHHKDELVSSTRIRELISEGEMEAARQLLGRHYQIRGKVQVGKQRGSNLIGFPTANLRFNEEDLVPKTGVYVTQVVYAGKCYGGVLNIGYNPTFSEKKLVAETHIFDFNKDIYGQKIKVNLLKFLRSEQKYSGVAELAAQIAKDVKRAKEVLQAQATEFSMSCSEELN